MTGERPERGLLHTNILMLRRWVAGAELPAEMAISAVTLAELSAARTRSAATTRRASMTSAWNERGG
jgi:hypothetical protein